MSETISDANKSEGRRRAMLRTAMGPTIAAALADPAVIEIMVNPDGVLRLDRLGEGRVDTGTRYEPAQVERIVRLVASHARTEVHAASPIVSAELPPHGEGAGERFEGVLPPVSLAPCFSIRKPAAKIYTLLDYVTDGIMSADTARILSLAVVDRKNILVAGGTSSGKTTLANALLAEMAHLDERVILIEDTRELQCAAPDVVALRIVGFRYLGERDGKHRIISVDDDDRVMVRYECSKPCKIIKRTLGSETDRIPYDPRSVIGAAFEDALNGSLRVAKGDSPGRQAEQAAATIPGAFVGEWNEDLQSCGTDNNDSRLRIEPRRLRFYESDGEVQRVTNLNARSIKVAASFAGEGESWSDEVTFVLSGSGDDLSSGNVTRHRCPR